MPKSCSDSRKTFFFLVILATIVIIGGICILFMFGCTVPPEQNGSSQSSMNVSSSGNNTSSLFGHWQDITTEKVGIRIVTEEYMITFITKWSNIRNWGVSDAEILVAVKTLEETAAKANTSSEKSHSSGWENQSGINISMPS